MRIGVTSAVVLATLALLSLTMAWGCGSPATAEPLEVTYYYLPG